MENLSKMQIEKNIKNTYNSIINSAASLNQITVKISTHVNMTVLNRVIMIRLVVVTILAES